jgi:hypothetical protein
MRALLPSIIVFSATLLAPSAHGNTVEPGPTGSVPTGQSFFLTFDHNSSSDSRSYIVDRKGFYERDSWSKSSNTGIGPFRESEDSNKGFSSTNLSVNSFNSKGANGSPGWSFSGGAGLSGGASNGAGASLSGGGGFYSMKGLLEGAGFAGGKGSGFILSALSGSGSNGSLGLGSLSAGGSGDPPGVAATPLPASWTMMLIGLAFGLFVWFRKIFRSPKRERVA